MAISAAAAAAAPVAAQCTRDPFPEVPFDSRNLSEHVRVLASDEFAGRAPASKGEEKTIEYLTRQFRKLGLQPAGDRGGWTQAVPLRRIEVARSAPLRIAFGETGMEFNNGDAAVFTSFTGQTEVELEGVPLVFVGYGVAAPELGWDDFKGVDVRGKAAVFLVNDPDFEAATPGKFGGSAMTYYGRWTYKFEEAARRGAAAALIVHEDAPAAYGWVTVQNSWGVPVFDIARRDTTRTHTPIRGWLRRDAAVRLFEQAGLDLEVLKRRAMQPDFKPQELKGARLSTRLSVRITPVLSHNVVAKLAGRERADESLIYGAHWDHLGIGKPDETGDRVYHGAVDNAIGVAGLLEMARVFASGPPTARSVYFVAFTAEEQGLLGAEYYTLHPLVPLEQTAAVLNMDIFGTDGATCDLSIRGTPNSSLHTATADVARAQGRYVSPDSHLAAGYYYRTDHFPFAKKGVPGITTMPGLDLVDGGLTAGRKAYDDYIAHRYHQPADRWSPDWDLRGLALDLGVLYRVGRDIASSANWPQWYEGSEFKRVRDESAATRGTFGPRRASDPARAIASHSKVLEP